MLSTQVEGRILVSIPTHAKWEPYNNMLNVVPHHVVPCMQQSGVCIGDTKT